MESEAPYSERSTPALGLWQGLSRRLSILRPILEYFIPREQGLYSFKWLIANIHCKKKKKEEKTKGNVSKVCNFRWLVYEKKYRLRKRQNRS